MGRREGACRGYSLASACPPPPRGAPSYPTFLPETTALFTPPVLDGTTPALPSGPQGPQAPRPPANEAVIALTRVQVPGGPVAHLVITPQGSAWPHSPGALIGTSVPATRHALALQLAWLLLSPTGSSGPGLLPQSLPQRPLLACKRWELFLLNKGASVLVTVPSRVATQS